MALFLARRCGAQMLVNVCRQHSLRKQLSTVTYKQMKYMTQINGSISTTFLLRANYSSSSSSTPANQTDAPSTPETVPIRPKTEVSFDELLDLIEKEELLLIDVREPKEVEKSGQIPNSINVPLMKLKAALSSGEEEEFYNTYERPKPAKSASNIVFYGLSDVKGAAAVEIAHKSGYKQARHFPGGFSEWTSKNKQVAASD